MNLSKLKKPKRRKFFKFAFSCLFVVNFFNFINYRKKNSIITKRIGKEYWILSSDDL